MNCYLWMHHTGYLWAEATLSRHCRIPGKFRIVPIIGICRRKFTADGRNPPKRSMKPHISRSIPINAHPRRTNEIPPKNSDDPFTLCHWKKKSNVLWMPITSVRPTMKSRFPIANNALSRNKTIPSPINVIPNSVSPTPICFELLNVQSIKAASCLSGMDRFSKTRILSFGKELCSGNIAGRSV